MKVRVFGDTAVVTGNDDEVNEEGGKNSNSHYVLDRCVCEALWKVVGLSVANRGDKVVRSHLANPTVIRRPMLPWSSGHAKRKI